MVQIDYNQGFNLGVKHALGVKQAMQRAMKGEYDAVWQEYMDQAYARWQRESGNKPAGDLAGLSREDFIAALDQNHREAAILGILKAEIYNGGFQQWVENGYGDEIHQAIDILNDIPGTYAKKVVNMLERLEPFINVGAGKRSPWILNDPETWENCEDVDTGDEDEDGEPIYEEECTEEEGEAEPPYEQIESLTGKLDHEFDAISDDFMIEVGAYFLSKTLPPPEDNKSW